MVTYPSYQLKKHETDLRRVSHSGERWWRCIGASSNLGKNQSRIYRSCLRTIVSKPSPSKPRALLSLGQAAGAQPEPARANPGDRQERARKPVISWCVLTSNTSINRSAAGACLSQSGIDGVPSETGFVPLPDRHKVLCQSNLRAYQALTQIFAKKLLGSILYLV